MINSPKGPLELLYHPPMSTSQIPPSSPSSSSQPSGNLHAKPPLLFVHGALCSAHDFAFLLPRLAAHGYHAYALSVRGHGKSYSQSFLGKLLFTTGRDWGRDIACALSVVNARHTNAPPPVLGGHSLGGGFVQYFLGKGTKFASGRDSESRRPQTGERKGNFQKGRIQIATPTNGASASTPSSTSIKVKSKARMYEVSALILLAAAPLSGEGTTINANWHDAEKRAGQTRGKNLFDKGPPAMLDTPEKVRAVFFSEETEDEVVDQWLKECKTDMEGGVAGLRCFRKMGDYRKVLRSIGGLAQDDHETESYGRVGQPDDGRETKKRRKILFVAGGSDMLVKPEMVRVEYETYAGVARKMEGKTYETGPDKSADETCMHFVVDGSGHHLMMDAHWEECATCIVRWLESESLVS